MSSSYFFGQGGNSRKSGDRNSHCNCVSVVDYFQPSYSIHQDKQKFGALAPISIFSALVVQNPLRIINGYDTKKNQISEKGKQNYYKNFWKYEDEKIIKKNQREIAFIKIYLY